MVGNIGGNYIVRFHEKMTGFLLAELTIAFSLCARCHTHALSFLSALEANVAY